MIRLLVLFAILPAAEGEESLSVLARTDLTCPACRTTFVTVICPQTNTRAGVDRDLFARALGPQPDFYLISTCPKCGYSGYLADFNADVNLPPDVRQKILKEPRLKLPPGFTEKSSPRELDARYRYDLAITCYRWRQRSEESIAWLHLRASWIEREEGSALASDDRLKRVMSYIERWRPPLDPAENQVDVEMRTAARIAEALAVGRFNRHQKPYVQLALALILRRHGENRQAGPLLDGLAAKPNLFSTVLREGIARMRASLPKERRHQQEAANAFEQALLTNQVAPPNRGPALYLLGELCRRLDRDRQAVRWFDQALADPSLPQDLRNWAADQKAWCLTNLTRPDQPRHPSPQVRRTPQPRSKPGSANRPEHRPDATLKPSALPVFTIFSLAVSHDHSAIALIPRDSNVPQESHPSPIRAHPCRLSVTSGKPHAT